MVRPLRGLAILGLTAATMVSGACGTSNPAPPAPTPVGPPDYSHTTPLTVDQVKNATPSQVQNFIGADSHMLTATFAAELDKWRPTAYVNVHSHFPDGLIGLVYTDTPGGYGPDKKLWSDQDIVDAVNLDINTAVSQSLPSKGTLELATVVDAKSKTFQSQNAQIENGGIPSASQYISAVKVEDPAGRPKNGMFDRFTTSSNARVVHRSWLDDSGSTRSNSDEYALYDIVESNGVSNWKLLEVWPAAEMATYFQNNTTPTS